MAKEHALHRPLPIGLGAQTLDRIIRKQSSGYSSDGGGPIN